MTTYRNLILAHPSLVGFWPLNESSGDAIDLVGAKNGTVTAVTRPTSGIPGGDTAYGFNGTSSKVDVAYDAALNPATSFSAEVWARCTGGAGVIRSPLTSRDGSGGATRGYIVYANSDNTWQFWAGDGTGSWRILPGSGVVLNQWAHIVCVHDASITRTRLYVNGALVSTSSAFTFVQQSTYPLRFGAGATEGAGSLWFPGNVDDVAFYNAALDANTILQHYTVGNTNPNRYAQFQLRPY